MAMKKKGYRAGGKMGVKKMMAGGRAKMKPKGMRVGGRTKVKMKKGGRAK